LRSEEIMIKTRNRLIDQLIFYAHNLPGEAGFLGLQRNEYDLMFLLNGKRYCRVHYVFINSTLQLHAIEPGKLFRHGLFFFQKVKLFQA